MYQIVFGNCIYNCFTYAIFDTCCISRGIHTHMRKNTDSKPNLRNVWIMKYIFLHDRTSNCLRKLFFDFFGGGLERTVLCCVYKCLYKHMHSHPHSQTYELQTTSVACMNREIYLYAWLYINCLWKLSLVFLGVCMTHIVLCCVCKCLYNHMHSHSHSQK